MSDGAVARGWHEYRDRLRPVQGEVIEEAQVTIYLNGEELATIMTTPRELEALALGFIKNEGFIEHLAEVDHVYVSLKGCCADVWLTHAIEPPRRKIITSGCGGGVTFRDPTDAFQALDTDIRVDPAMLFELFNQLQDPESLYARARGVHTAGLTDGEKLLCTVEDVGRHNTIDKLVGIALMREIETEGRILLVSGRISSEMLLKAVVMGCPVIASRNSPTSMSLSLADELGVTVIGYVRRNTLRVYSHVERLDTSIQAVKTPGDQLDE